MSNDMVEILINRAKEKMAARQFQDHEIIVGIMAMAKNYSLGEETVTYVLQQIFEGDRERLAKALAVSSQLIDEDFIRKIIEEAN